MTLQQELNYSRRAMQGPFMSVAPDEQRGQRKPPRAGNEKATSWNFLTFAAVANLLASLSSYSRQSVCLPRSPAHRRLRRWLWRGSRWRRWLIYRLRRWGSLFAAPRKELQHCSIEEQC